ncbi:MAG: hypothetical protein ACREQL_01190, partial [Candidatus Binatia bacterium]
MRTIRLLFVALAVALLVPIALLVHRAVRSVALEREMRHRAVAERVFDEMERGLSDFLGREEARPFEHYVEGEPAPPFVLGYFQIDPGGRVEVHAAAGAAETVALEGAVRRLRAG